MEFGRFVYMFGTTYDGRTRSDAILCNFYNQMGYWAAKTLIQGLVECALHIHKRYCGWKGLKSVVIRK